MTFVCIIDLSYMQCSFFCTFGKIIVYRMYLLYVFGVLVSTNMNHYYYYILGWFPRHSLWPVLDKTEFSIKIRYTEVTLIHYYV